MGFDNSAGPNPKYRTAEHRKYRASLVAQLKRDGYLTCTAKVCVFDTRDITNPNGRERDGLHAGHNDAGTEYDGPQHNLCNVRDGARRGRARQDATNLQWLQGEAAPHPWLRKDYHPCPVCTTPVPWASQRCCSRSCSTTLRRRAKAKSQPRVVECAPCSICSTPTPHKRCSEECRVEWMRRYMRDRYRAQIGLPVDPDRPSKPWIAARQLKRAGFS